MKLKHKLLTASILAFSTSSIIYSINQFIKYFATKSLKNNEDKYLDYDWRLGNIKYRKIGSGSPILLIHDLDSAFSSVEWDKIINILSKKYEVYTIDLIGCGLSEKPGITYTNFVYVQLIIDFIKAIIGKRTNVIVSHNSCPIVTMACKMDDSLFNKIIYVSPDETDEVMLVPSKLARSYKLLVASPIIGTLIYNIASAKSRLRKRLSKKIVKNNFPFINNFYANSHMGSSPKSLYSSIICNYTKINYKWALSSINNSIIIFTGNHNKNSSFEDYKKLNPSIEIFKIDNALLYPHIENPLAFINELNSLI